MNINVRPISLSVECESEGCDGMSWSARGEFEIELTHKDRRLTIVLDSAGRCRQMYMHKGADYIPAFADLDAAMNALLEP